MMVQPDIGPALGGGALIGAASVLLLLADGEIAGISGIGAAIFGIGWGLAGFCPGPALADLSLGLPAVLLFVGTMLVGMWVHRLTTRPNPEPGAAAMRGAS